MFSVQAGTNMKRTVGLFFFFFIVTALGYAQADLQPVAIVRLTRSEPITVKQYRTEVEKLEAQVGRLLSRDERKQVLDVMINSKLLMQAAERDKITISDNEVNQQLQQLRNNMAQSIGRTPTEQEFAQAVRSQTGLELPAYREELRKELLTQKYMMEKKGAILNTLKTPTEQEITNMYALNRSQLVRPESVRISMISVPFENAASKTKAKEIADRLVRDIGTNPARFDEAILKGKPLNPSAEYMSGDAGYLPRNPQSLQLVGQDFMNIAFSLKQGEVSRLIESSQAYQIIKITETYVQKNLELDDIFQLGTPLTVRDFIGNSLLQEAEQALVTRVTQELVTELRAGNPFQIYEANLNW
jgi:parvulin-like peptidyl-prolyl isomerase